MSRSTIPLHGDTAVAGLYEAIVERLPEAIVVTALDGLITFLNPAAEALTGYQAPKLLGRNITVLAHAQPGQRADPVKWLARWAAEPPQEQARFLDLQIRTADDRELIVGVRVAQGEVDGEPRYFLTVRDVSNWRREMNAFKQANLLAQRILLVAEDAIVSCDANQKITFFNLSAESVFGYQVEEAVGQPLTMLMPAGARAEHKARLMAFGAAAQPSQMMTDRREISGQRKSGEIFPMEAAISKVSVNGVTTFTAHVRDISERKAAQDKHEETERRFKAIFEHAREAIALLSPDGRVLEFNRSARTFLAEGEVLDGTLFWDLPWIGDPPAARAVDGRARLRSAVEAAATGLDVRYVAEVEEHGRLRRIDLMLTPIVSSTGEVLYILPEARELPPP